MACLPAFFRLISAMACSPRRGPLLALVLSLAVLPAIAGERELLRVGVKTDYPPWGFVCGSKLAPCPPQAGPVPPGAEVVIAGLEPDLALALGRALGDRLGRPLEVRLVPVTTANRLQLLAAGDVDVVIATMAATAERRRLADLVEPPYYASGVSALVASSSPITAMADLSGERVCLTSGAFFNRRLVEDLGVQPRLYHGTRDALIALKTGACAAYAYDDTALKQVMLQPGWAEFRLLEPSIDVTDWVIAVPLGTADEPLGQALAATLDEWHRTGFLLAQEARWGLDCSPALVRARLERGGSLAATPPSCRSLPAAALATTPAIAALPPGEDGWSPHHVDLVLRGLVVTAVLSVASIVGALAVGLGGAFFAYALPGWIARVREAVSSHVIANGEIWGR
ncbi:MAG: transporter substrate-binding domain-containing protein [Pseudomonadota bacterium]